VRCGRCGNENSETNRFCGMCGAPLLAKAQAVAQPSGPGTTARPTGSVAAATPVAVPAQKETARTVARESSGPVVASGVTVERSPSLSSFGVRASDVRPSDVKASAAPVITGPSFLGLNTPTEPGHDALQPSSNVDYLLEDDEEEPKRGWGKFVLVLAALVLAAGFGYLHWKQGGFAWLNSGGNKTAAAPTAEGTQNGAASGSPSGAASPISATTPTGTVAPASVPVTGGATPAAAPVSSPVAASPDSSQSAASQTAALQGPASQSGAVTPAQTPPTPTQESNSSPPAESASQNGATAPTSEPNSAETPTTPAQKIPIRKPSPAKLPAKPVDLVAEAERLIYGNGVRQDCDRGMRGLKSAAEQSNAKAMISLGAVYSTGTCVPRDLPTSYRWFALALHKEPDNQSLQDDLQKVWGQMTQAERQLAIKLSQ